MTDQAQKGDWVQIFKVILEPEERAPGLPPETAKVPLTMKVKGFLIEKSARPGDYASIQTVTGRIVEGELIAVNPPYAVDYGHPQPELLTIGLEARKMLKEGADKT